MIDLTRDTKASLNNIKRPIELELKEFSKFFRDAMRSKVGLVDLVARYIIRQKGKRVRPILVFLSAKACGPVTDSTYRAATLVEILHTATLIHDDVVDDADTRRGLASINAVWKNKVAVLMGDYLLSRGLLLSLEHGDYYFLRRTSDAVKRMSEGELLQIQKSRQLNIDEETYFRIISDKTASLLSTCTEIGAASTTEDPQRRQHLRSFGEHIGIAFQIRDDLLDYMGRKSVIGKPTGIDLKEKKLTLPLIHALSKASRGEAKETLRIIKNGAKQKDVQWVVDLVKRMGGIDYSVDRAQHYSSLARADLATLPDSDSKEALLEFVDFVMERDS
jgi:octaprenyl-diphosphate synthase